MYGQDHKTLGRTAVLLLALADLAERAGRACVPVRLLVLWILRGAETVARLYAEEVVGTPVFGADGTDDAPGDDASRLAERLRALAILFQTLAHFARLAQKPPATPRGLLPCSPAVDRLRTIVAVFAHSFDTS